MDILASFTGLLVLLPFSLILLPALAFSNKGPILFIQTRPGFRGKLFRLMKFKTMNDRRDKTGRLLPDNERLTGVGRFIRSLSLDEFPQLINVLKGDMSLVGPRPLLPEYLPLYNAHQARRHEVRPGITGWAQVNGRNAISWEQKFDLDVWYVDHLSFWLDMKILFMTLVNVIRREGINSDTATTMKRFTGSEKSKA
ncbi:MAG: sugar transferase [Bacteroidales bacterium]|nr:sugar transferase [Bacteroidales bacterium]